MCYHDIILSLHDVIVVINGNEILQELKPKLTLSCNTIALHLPEAIVYIGTELASINSRLTAGSLRITESNIDQPAWIADQVCVYYTACH